MDGSSPRACSTTPASTAPTYSRSPPAWQDRHVDPRAIATQLRRVDDDPDAVVLTKDVIGDRGRVVAGGDASATGLDDASTDVAVGEAMLTMQSDRNKAEIVGEAFRVLRPPGGRYAIHELAINPDTLPDEDKTEIRKSLARSIKVNARPLTEQSGESC